ncbi:MAG: tryptophan synthase subunit alpha [Candidatus Epulonipiscium fishelsonii]|nr:MAG: tryptophan synthase subunit alpha [Epulopiscium sp. AS2M-Bin002]
MNKFIFNNKAFIPFITAGDPSIEVSRELILAMQAEGASLIEIGLPFSDPVAEGITIQKANMRALANGTTTDKIFDMIASIKDEIKVPLAIMTYINPIFTYGVDRFMKKCKEVGVSGVIVPDMPFEEKGEIYDICKQYGIKLVSLIAPTSTNRLEKIASEAEGFLYCVSSLGVTGVRTDINTNMEEIINEVKRYSDIPCMIGFGISTPKQARDMARVSDGVIVGSAIVRIIEEYGENSVPHVRNYIRGMIDAIKGI